ncbi:adenosine 5'-monophosphoramidase HINT1-like [Paramacrobiotus metropolitanus]|uniref:adenosine 5'-monophosphoramidase HINT1-like n=1 Tax=Paramacrobiotus metropolitanus TaxID=2943436 RepID=UPI0024461597|nr:adenosine 5'-monophosphoramidase HINT1-like [Paramacrobiotus metropolitanus]
MSIISKVFASTSFWTTSLLALRASSGFCARHVTDLGKLSPETCPASNRALPSVCTRPAFSTSAFTLNKKTMADASESDEVQKAQTMKSSSAPSIFTRIINKEIPGKFLYEDDQCVVLVDVNPQAPVHFLVVPRRQLEGLSHATDADELLLGHLLNVARKVADQEKLHSGYRVVINDGKHGAQSVPHLHIHVFGKRQMGWPPG